jgi:hypothetical protein
MYRRPRLPSGVKHFLLWSAPLVWLGCGGGGGTDIVLPSLSVTTTTGGVELDPDGYSFAVDGSGTRPIGLDATVTIDDLTDGQHTVTLSGLAQNCAAGENPRSVTVSAGSTASTSFAVTCGTTTGSIVATVATTGTGVDPDGFDLTLDGTSLSPIDPNGTLNVTSVSAGTHLLGLGGVAANCRVTGDNPRSVAVLSGIAATEVFLVACDVPVANPGIIQVSTITTGTNPDPDGYGVSIDGGAPQQIPPSATLTLTNIPAGPHAVQLLGVATNCSVSGDNPASVAVSAGGTAATSFAITCTAPPPDAGGVQITTTTTGNSPDDSYTATIDGGSPQPLTGNASVTVGGLRPGSHRVRLAGIESNCTVAGANPRSVGITAGQTTPVAFTITCVTPPPSIGSLRITATTSGGSPDNSYTVSVDGGTARTLASNASLTVDEVPVGPHLVQLGDVAANCTVSGANPRAVTVLTGQTASLTFSIACVTPPPGTGSVVISAATSGASPDPDGYTVSIDGGSSQTLGPNASITVSNLAPGNHSAQLAGVAPNCTLSGTNPRTVSVVAAQTSNISFAIACVSTSPSVNFRISNLYLIQSTQTPAGTVPLVAGRAALLRVFVIASQTSGARPSVQVTLQHGATVVQRTISAPAGGAPTSFTEGILGSSWNLPIEASLIQPGLSIRAEVDPENAIAETNESDNAFPGQGPQTLNVAVAPIANIRFVPIQQGVDGQPGNVTNSTKDQLVELARRMYPLNEITTDIHAVMNVPAGSLQADGTGWTQVLTEVNGMRLMEGSDRTYYGLAKLDFPFVGRFTVGIAFLATPAAMGSDDPQYVVTTLTHELGHTWNQFHTPCGLFPSDPTIDLNYPYGNGIGMYGFDVATNSLKLPSTPDIMGYCNSPWVSDYTYRRIMDYRAATSSVSQVTSASRQPSLLVWGRIVNGQPVLEPAFHISARPQLPNKPGPYSVEGVAQDGSSLFRLSFEATVIADDPSGSRHFAFTIPLDQARAMRLESLRASGPQGTAVMMSLSSARISQAAVPDSISVRRRAGGVELDWNPAAHRMIIVRDPDTGEVLSLGRGGKAQVATTKTSLDLIASDGVRSRSMRVRPR